MMLEFIFKYTWIGMLVLVYVIWSVESIKDIIETKRMYHELFSLDDIDETSHAWILVSIVCIFSASFIYWVFYGIE